jgi:acetyl-CoA carboxylase carboxyltransferase component
VLDAIRRFLSYLPSNAGFAPPVLPCRDPAERRDGSLLDIVPDNPRRAYDVRRIIAWRDGLRQRLRAEAMPATS